ncbi:hypothetical protein KUL42_33200 [Alteromonas sp. KUL42]|uniref:hypothetical protein n=1 Tax=Alteromonas sp. KUL42 TaxID=2480797 RepID=UPI001036EA3B|nr:hypothetical protein [Alteromonas sp. KUL42]TAP33330.1 hypothetical protein EYR97_15660 [Alteromonas sp. KUL42]GEA08559.1 hypothetical protein KUL42_33200 [Alteromonas sp. KUL42]
MMKLLVSFIGLFVFFYLTDVSSASLFNKVLSPVLGGVFAAIFVGTLIAKSKHSKTGSNNDSSGFFVGGSSSSNDCGSDGGGDC